VLGVALSVAGAAASVAAEGPLRGYALTIAALTAVLAGTALAAAARARTSPPGRPRVADATGSRPRRTRGLAPGTRFRVLGFALSMMAVGWVVVAAQQRVGVAVVVAGGLLLLLASGGPRPPVGAGRR